MMPTCIDPTVYDYHVGPKHHEVNKGKNNKCRVPRPTSHIYMVGYEGCMRTPQVPLLEPFPRPRRMYPDIPQLLPQEFFTFQYCAPLSSPYPTTRTP
mmetsp:Transcript_12626/g.25749  ORF Transcript_12626/g.25749 Transcript_12626/m.25749 type:complete len:97 (-) Transcript_12626:852-1142(-)